MDIIAAYREAGTYRGAAQIAGTTHKTVKRVIERYEAGGATPDRRFTYYAAFGGYNQSFRYFDQNNGASKFRVLINDHLIDEWVADGHLPSTKPNGDSSSWRRIRAIAIRPEDEIVIEGFPDAQELAPLDYVELHSVFESK